MINPLGFLLTIGLYKGAEALKKSQIIKRTFVIKSIFALPPIFIAGTVLLILMKSFNIDFNTYNESAKYITFLLTPATIALGYPVFKYKDLLVKHKRVIYSAFIFAAMTAICLTYIIAKFCHSEYKIIISMLPKSVTAPIAVEISKELGGIPELTACMVVLTGVFGAMFGHKILEIIRVKSDVAIGLAMGAASHVIGTARCVEKGRPKQVVMASVALVIVGVVSAVLAPFFVWIIK